MTPEPPSPPASPRPTSHTTVHLVRHGEVFNPEGVLYGRLPGYHLSELGQAMAKRAGEYLAGRDVALLTCSPLERTRETAAGVAGCLDLEVDTDERLIEAGNSFEGLPFDPTRGVLRRPGSWALLRNPMRPSWGEPYVEIVARMLAVVGEARQAARGREAVLISHQLPIWVTRLAVEQRRLWHDPRKRQCSLASVTTLTYVGAEVTAVAYAEPAGDLLPGAQDGAGA
jgi:broad specificity phosphatase PhoE